MDIIYHIGAHCTDEERLVRCLLKNRGILAETGVAVPAPGRYRQILRDTLVALKGAPASRETQEIILEAVVDQEDVKRLIFSHEFFLGIPQRVVSDQGLYASAGRRVAALSNLFPDEPCEFHIAMRNPATLIPALVARPDGGGYSGIVGDNDPEFQRWAPVIAQITAAVPEARVVVWCNEDSPMIWPEIIRRMTRVPDDTGLEGEDDLLAAIMQPDGFRRMQQYLTSHPPKGIPQRRRMVGAFLARFGLPEEMDVDIALPNWTDDMVAEMTRAYDADLSEIFAMDRVDVILP